MRRGLVLSGIAIVLLLAVGELASACTIGVASGEVTQDGRPLLWKVRQWADTNGNHVFWANGPVYGFLGIKGSVGETEVRMGVNTAGLATGNALVGGTGNSAFIVYALGNFATVAQVQNYLETEIGANRFEASSNFPFIDAQGNAVMFETDPNNPNPALRLVVYNTLDPDRIGQGLYGWVVRANELHQILSGMDDTSIQGRYEAASFNTSGLIGLNLLSDRTVTQGNNGSIQYEFFRYGPQGYGGHTTIAADNACSAMAVHGVAPGEKQGLTTMWALLGQPNFGIATPIWTSIGSVPPLLADGELARTANWLRDNSQESVVQASVFPAEKHLFDEVDELMGQFRIDTVHGMALLPRIATGMSEDAFSLLHCLRFTDNDNHAPTVGVKYKNLPPTSPVWSSAQSVDPLAFRFNAAAADSDGVVDSIVWDFGDDSVIASGAVVDHTYAKPGMYLVSCRVTDDDGVSTTDWLYVRAGNRCGGLQGIRCAAGNYCKMPDDTCRWADLFGICTPVPASCPPGGPAVCGCNDVTYRNECFAEMARVSIAHDGACAVDAEPLPEAKTE